MLLSAEAVQYGHGIQDTTFFRRAKLIQNPSWLMVEGTLYFTDIQKRTCVLYNTYLQDQMQTVRKFINGSAAVGIHEQYEIPTGSEIRICKGESVHRPIISIWRLQG